MSIHDDRHRMSILLSNMLEGLTQGDVDTLLDEVVAFNPDSVFTWVKGLFSDITPAEARELLQALSDAHHEMVVEWVDEVLGGYP